MIIIIMNMKIAMMITFLNTVHMLILIIIIISILIMTVIKITTAEVFILL